MTPTRGARWVASAALASVLLRARAFTTPLTVDEAGALVVARSWGRGQHLYVDVFIDRPQGVVALFQRWDVLVGGAGGPGGPASVRVLALIAGVLVVVGAATAARAVSGSWRAGALAAWLAAVISSSPAIEGYAANGELLAAGLTVPAFALGALVITGRRPSRWLVLAGALAAGGISMKQSGYDVLVALALWLVVAGAVGWRPRRQAAVQLALLAAGAGAVLAALAVHGASLGWDAYTYALYEFRLHARSIGAGGQWRRLAITTAVATPLFGPAAAVAAQHLRRLSTGPGSLRARVRPEHVLVIGWFAVSTAAFAVGGNYHRHYWVGLAAPAAVLSAVVLVAGRPDQADPRGRDVAPLLVRALWLPLLVSLVLLAAPRLERDRRVDADAAIATWLVHHRVHDTDQLLPLCASVTFYAETGEEPLLPYLWVDHIRAARGATDQLVALLESPDRPAFVAMHQPAQRCDPSGRVRAALDRHYRQVAEVHGVPLLHAQPARR